MTKSKEDAQDPAVDPADAADAAAPDAAPEDAADAPAPATDGPWGEHGPLG